MSLIIEIYIQASEEEGRIVKSVQPFFVSFAVIALATVLTALAVFDQTPYQQKNDDNWVKQSNKGY